jgi:CMP-N,N'-diacetyllegionaminic acid synthase
MIDNDLVIAFIPARGGSKGLPGKNMLEINGKSLIELAVESSRGDLIGTPVDLPFSSTLTSWAASTSSAPSLPPPMKQLPPTPSVIILVPQM